MEQVTSVHLEQAERALRSRAAAATTVDQLNVAIAERFGMSRELVASYVEQRYDTAKKKYFPGIDPRIEQDIQVLLRHALLVGAGAAKISEGKG
jgi:hypothetical protein